MQEGNAESRKAAASDDALRIFVLDGLFFNDRQLQQAGIGLGFNKDLTVAGAAPDLHRTSHLMTSRLGQHVRHPWKSTLLSEPAL